jgi:hypothetical protein
MNSQQIKNFIANKVTKKDQYVKIEFGKREPIYGLFVTDNDFSDLSAKNFWRIVTSKHFDAYSKTKDINLSRIFNGTEFSKLSLLSDEF